MKTLLEKPEIQDVENMIFLIEELIAMTPGIGYCADRKEQAEKYGRAIMDLYSHKDEHKELYERFHNEYMKPYMQQKQSDDDINGIETLDEEIRLLKLANPYGCTPCRSRGVKVEDINGIKTYVVSVGYEDHEGKFVVLSTYQKNKSPEFFDKICGKYNLYTRPQNIPQSSKKWS